MGKKSAAKIEVTKYFMSQHFGICMAPVDAMIRIVIKERAAWTGEETIANSFAIDNDQLFGGSSKEGGVEGVVYWLPGDDAQVLPDLLAQKLGRADGADAPGYRGLASVFMVGPAGTPFANLSSFSDQTHGKAGFYWSANSPYLPGVWITVRRASVGLDPAYAFCGGVAGPSAAICIVIDKSSQMNSGSRMQTARDGIVGYLQYLRGLVVAGRVVDLEVRRLYSTTNAATYRSASVADVDSAIAFIEATTTGSTIICDWRPAALGAKAFFDDADALIDDRQLFWVVHGQAGFQFMADEAAVTVNSIAPAPSIKTFLLGTSDASDCALIDNTPSDGIPEISPGDDAALTDAMIGSVAEGIGPTRDSNPAHIIYECLTNTDWGMGSPAAAFDTDSFNAAAVTLYGENFCLSLIWTRQASIQDFIQEVLDHIVAVLFVDPSTGLLTMKLIRGDYDPDDLDEITPDNAVLTNFNRKLWGEIPNEIVVTWTNPENEQEETAPPAQDLASIATQGLITDSRNYYGVRNASLAQRLAFRDLQASGQPLATFEAELDRTQWQLRPASVIKVTWPEYGLDGVVGRVTSVDYGRPGDMNIKVSLIEDVFGLDFGAYDEPPSSGWVDPSSPPEPLTIERIFTMPLFFAANSSVADFVDTPEYPEVVAGILGTTTQEDAYAFDLWDEITLGNGSLQWQSLATLNIIGHAELYAGLDAEAASTGVTFDNVIGDNGPVVAGFVIIGDGEESENEIAMIDAVGATYDLVRGVLDTVPRAWTAGTPVWFVDDATPFEYPAVLAGGDTLDVKLLTRTSQGALALASAALVSHDLTERPWLPNRPANVLAYGVDFSSAVSPVDAIARPNPWVTVTWAERNRLLEDSQVLAWTDATVTAETGQTTTLTVLKTDGVTVLATHAGLTGTTFDVPDASFGSEFTVIIRASSERTDADGTFESLQYFDHWVLVELATPGVEAASGVGAFAGVGASIVAAAFGASGVGGFAGASSGISAAVFGASGVGASSIVGAGVATGSFSASGTANLLLDSDLTEVWDMQWGPLENEAPATNYATLDTRNGHPCLDFDTTTQEAAYFHGVLPTNYTGAGVTVSIWCALTSATSGTVGWDVAIERIDVSSLDIDADSFATAQTVTATTVPGTSGQVLKQSVNISNGANMDSLAAGELFRIRIRRDVANDTATGDAELLRVMMVEQ